MKLERLHQLFEQANTMELEFKGTCHDCRKEISIIISLSSTGFQIEGGAVYEPKTNAFYVKCESCFKKKPELVNYQSCDVYSRVVGYLQPVKQWNEGKQSEFKDRKLYKI